MSVLIVLLLAVILEWRAYLSWEQLVRTQHSSLTTFPTNSELPFRLFGQSYTVLTNELGFLDHPVAGRIRPDGQSRIAIVGDSMAQGLGVPVEHSFPALLARKLTGKAHVFNLSHQGTGPGHFRCVLEELALRMEFHHVVFVSYLPNDFIDAVYEESRPCFWWRSYYAREATYPYALRLWQHQGHADRGREQILPPLRWESVLRNLWFFLRHSQRQDEIGTALRALWTAGKSVATGDAVLLRLLSQDRFAYLPHSLQLEVLRGTIYPYTAMGAFTHPFAFKEGSGRSDLASARAYFTQLDGALAAAARAGVTSFTIVPLVAPDDFDQMGQQLLSELGFVFSAESPRQNLRLKQLYQWHAIHAKDPGPRLRILDPTAALREGAAQGSLLIPYDIHFNRQGHLVLGDWLARELR